MEFLVFSFLALLDYHVEDIHADCEYKALYVHIYRIDEFLEAVSCYYYNKVTRVIHDVVTCGPSSEPQSSLQEEQPYLGGIFLFFFFMLVLKLVLFISLNISINSTIPSCIFELFFILPLDCIMFSNLELSDETSFYTHVMVDKNISISF